MAKHRIGLIIPLTDVDLRSLGRQQQRFADAGAAVMIGSEPDIRLCRDKAQTNELFGRAGLGTIKTVSLKEFYDEPFYPCFVKPIRGSASFATAVIHNEKELRAHVATFGDLLLVQEYVPGREYTIDIYRDRKGAVRSVVPRQRLAVRAGEVSKGITVKDDQLIEASIKLAGLLGSIWGVFCASAAARKEANRGSSRSTRDSAAARRSPSPPAPTCRSTSSRRSSALPITAKVGEFTDNLLMLRYDDAVFVQVDDRKALPGYDTPSFR